MIKSFEEYIKESRQGGEIDTGYHDVIEVLQDYFDEFHSVHQSNQTFPRLGFGHEIVYIPRIDLLEINLTYHGRNAANDNGESLADVHVRICDMQEFLYGHFYHRVVEMGNNVVLLSTPDLAMIVI